VRALHFLLSIQIQKTEYEWNRRKYYILSNSIYVYITCHPHWVYISSIVFYDEKEEDTLRLTGKKISFVLPV
jgi:cAMP phosphodiesterase